MVTFDQITSTKWSGLTHLDAFGHGMTHPTEGPRLRTLANVAPSMLIREATLYGVRLPTLPDPLDLCSELAAAYVGLQCRKLALECAWLRLEV